MALDMKVLTAEHLLDAPPGVVGLVYEAMAEIQRDRAHVIDFLTGTELVLWVDLDGEAVAVEVVKKTQGGREWVIRILYVVAAYRSSGAVELIRDALRAIAIGDPDCHGLEWRVRVENQAMLKNLERGGLKANSLMFRTDVDALRAQK